jgi:WhiB family redox-sensing transcriptional regulator
MSTASKIEAAYRVFKPRGDIAWQRRAMCIGEDSDIFFPEHYAGPQGEKAVSIAKEICNTCEVKSECLAYAMRNKEAYGIWGGTTPRERGMKPKTYRPREHPERKKD